MDKNFDFKTDEEYFAAREDFLKRHPEAPQAQDIECLSLIMKKEYAKQILAGTKKVEYRSYSQFYKSRLLDKDVSEYLHEHIEDDEVCAFCNDIRQVKKIHFHDYNNSWFLDIEVVVNDAFILTKEGIEVLHDYGAHDYDEECEYLDRLNVKERPWTFYFVCGKVIDTNLEDNVNPREDISKDFNGGVVLSTSETKQNLKEKEEMEILKLKVNKGTFKDVVNHEINLYTEEITPRNQSKFFLMNEDGTVKEIKGIPQFRRYDAIQFINKEDTYTCLINDAEIVFWDDENYDLICYLELDEEEREDIDYTDCMIAYTLGDEVK